MAGIRRRSASRGAKPSATLVKRPRGRAKAKSISKRRMNLKREDVHCESVEEHMLWRINTPGDAGRMVEHLGPSDLNGA